MNKTFVAAWYLEGTWELNRHTVIVAPSRKLAIAWFFQTHPKAYLISCKTAEVIKSKWGK